MTFGTALVTGAGTGFGPALTTALTRLGTRVTAVARDADRLRARGRRRCAAGRARLPGRTGAGSPVARVRRLVPAPALRLSTPWAGGRRRERRWSCPRRCARPAPPGTSPPTRCRTTDDDLGRLSVVGGGSIYPTMQNFCLALRAQRVGSAVTTLLCRREPEVASLLEIPDGFITAAHIAVGYPARPFPRRLRRAPVSETVSAETFGTPLFSSPGENSG